MKWKLKGAVWDGLPIRHQQLILIEIGKGVLENSFLFTPLNLYENLWLISLENAIIILMSVRSKKPNGVGIYLEALR